MRRGVAAQLAVKRLMDVVAALILLLLAVPVLLVAATLIRLTSPGPILFRQLRVGRCEREFGCLKFRTMIIDQDAVLPRERVSADQAAGVLTKLVDDPRVTSVGAFLRKTSIDELPQLLNVLRGEMSLVGPRPLIPFMLEPYPSFRRARSVLRPGLTGLWQVSHRERNSSALDMQEHDLQYVEEFNLLLDLKILVRTIPAALRFSEAM